jgi:hypothetical protein
VDQVAHRSWNEYSSTLQGGRGWARGLEGKNIKEMRI